MNTLSVTLETLGTLLPELPEHFAKRLAELVKSCREMPNRKTARTMTIKVIVSPHPQDSDDVLITASVGSKIPAAELEVVRVRASRTNQLQFDFHGDQSAA